MIRTLDEIRRVAVEAKLSAGGIARACVPPLPPVTVWRVLNRKSGGTSSTVERISLAIDRLMPIRHQSDAPDASAAQVVVAEGEG